MSNIQAEGYSVWMMRRDREPILAIETANFEEADAVWKELKIKWAQALADKIPLELRAPYITSFDPALVYEITLLPFSNTKVSNDNPYQQNMKQKGFSNSFNKGSNVLDGGYSY